MGELRAAVDYCVMRPIDEWDSRLQRWAAENPNWAIQLFGPMLLIGLAWFAGAVLAKPPPLIGVLVLIIGIMVNGIAAFRSQGRGITWLAAGAVLAIFLGLGMAMGSWAGRVLGV